MQFPADLVTFTEKSLIKNLIFCTVDVLGKALQKILVLSKDSRFQPVSFLESELPPFWRV